ncbi:hypothetical protein ACFX13_026164 [Malus domestica]
MEGDDPLAWIYKAEQFFAFYQTPDAQRVLTTSFHLEGEVLQWFHWLDCTHSTPHWEDFTKAFCREFDTLEFEDSAESLFKLRQTGTLKDYITESRHLATRTRDLGPVLLKSCFLGGLKKELKFDVKLLKPVTVHDAISIALQLDAKLTELKPFTPKSFQPPKHLPLLPPPPLHPPPKPGNFGVKKLSPVEIQGKRERGECWFCPAKWTPGHKCGLKQLLMLDMDNNCYV